MLDNFNLVNIVFRNLLQEHDTIHVNLEMSPVFNRNYKLVPASAK